VYVVGHVPLAPEGVDLAAVDAAGGDAALSERSGAVRMGMLRFASAKIDVTTATRGRRAAIDGVTLHRTRGLPDSDRTLHLAIPIATVPRILLDLAARADISDRALESAAAQAERDGDHGRRRARPRQPAAGHDRGEPRPHHVERVATAAVPAGSHAVKVIGDRETMDATLGWLQFASFVATAPGA
jgi:hypothetical protein